MMMNLVLDLKSLHLDHVDGGDFDASLTNILTQAYIDLWRDLDSQNLSPIKISKSIVEDSDINDYISIFITVYR